MKLEQVRIWALGWGCLSQSGLCRQTMAKSE
jgi:hypothetical protein